MSFASRHNKVNRWNIDTKGFEYKKIKDIVAADGEDITYRVFGVMLNKGTRFGDSPSVILESCFVNLPGHLANEVASILESGEDIQDILEGNVGIQFYSYENKTGNVCYSANWVDL